MIAAVAGGEVGIIFSREASRLSRTDKDWCQLLEICRICKTLISDAENIYDLALGDDQLVLGIKATLSIAELSILKSRLIQGMENKAQRGELYRRIPPGYLCVDGKNLVKDPDRRIQDSILLIFKKFRKVSSVRQLMKWFHEENIELPVNKSRNGKNQIIWQTPKYNFLRSVLKNPTYAGVYFYGHREMKMIHHAEHGIKKIAVSRPVEDARIYIEDHHEKYISLQEYEENLAMIKNNNQRVAKASDEVSGIREGHGLLTGLFRCGRCGRKLHIRYWGKKGTAARYLCPGDYESGGKHCLGFELIKQALACGCSSIPTLNHAGLLNDAIWLTRIWVSSSLKVSASFSVVK
ncbi:MAG: recombinase family protein [Planctomycetes bacterium]|nr:recombinase family protein [Planctomycetota bacterium]